MQQWFTGVPECEKNRAFPCPCQLLILTFTCFWALRKARVKSTLLVIWNSLIFSASCHVLLISNTCWLTTSLNFFILNRATLLLISLSCNLYWFTLPPHAASQLPSEISSFPCTHSHPPSRGPSLAHFWECFNSPI